MDFADNVPDEARQLFERALSAQMDGRLEEAADLYTRSIGIWPTAEAHTFLGWVYSMQHRWDEAIDECHRAIAVDPDFGNPYNDIGAYLIELGRMDEAIPWLERAKRAARYEPRHYPHFNLARIYVRQHKVREAIAELERAVAIEPGYVLARRELHRLRGMLN
jgi:tetratricopeptide (TPR) repeat protein